MTEALIDQRMYNNLVEMVGDDFIGELLDTYLEDTPMLIGEMRQSLSQGNAPAFQRAAHSLKSSSASFGAVALADLARELEYLGRAGQLDGAAPKLEQLEAAYVRVEQALRQMS
jgi:HPt (histidine-containing phosphotransfer) domain-containing protein